MEMVVTGPADDDGAAVGAGAEATVGCWGELARLLPAGAEVGWAGELALEVEGAVGMRVMVDGTPVTIPGFLEMWGAQIPAK